MKYCRKILRISYKDHVTNEEVRAKIQQAIGTHEDLIIVKRRKLQWYGHVSRSTGLAKTILQGTVKGGRRQGRQKERWEDNIGNGQVWSSPSPRGQWKTEKNGENWLWSHLWCPSDPHGWGIGEGEVLLGMFYIYTNSHIFFFSKELVNGSTRIKALSLTRYGSLTLA